MKWQKSKREETTLHESHFSKFPSSKPTLLANAISHQLSNRWVHTLENTNTVWLWQQGKRTVGTREQTHGGCQPNLKNMTWLMPRDGVGLKPPTSGALLMLLVWNQIPPENLLSYIKSLITFVKSVLFSHRLYFHAYSFPDKRSHCDKVLFKSSQMSWGLTHKASSAQVLWMFWLH